MVSTQFIPISYRTTDSLNTGCPIDGRDTLRLMAPKRERTAFGARLYKARTHAQLTQPQLAKAAGMAQSTLGELEYDGNGSSYTAQLAKACGVRAEWLSEGIGEMLERETLSPAVAEVARAIDQLPERWRNWVLRATQEAIELAHQANSPNGDGLGQGDEVHTKAQQGRPHKRIASR